MRSIKQHSDQLMKRIGMEKLKEKKCETCGFEYTVYKTRRGIIDQCKECTEKRFIESLNLPTKEELTEIKETRFRERFETAPYDLLDATVNNYEPDDPSQVKAKNQIAAYIKGFENHKTKSVVLSGEPGLGKSHLAYATAKAIKKFGYTTLYLKSTDLLAYIRDTYRYDSPVSEEAILNMVAGLDLLVLDDVGSEYVKGDGSAETWASDILFRVFDSRLGKATFVTTNYGENDLRAKYGMNGGRIASRMLDSAIAMRIEGKDYRRQKEAF